MAVSKIPEPYVSGLRDLLTLEDAQMEELIKALESAPLALTAERLTDKIGASVPSIPKESLSDILESVVSLYWLRQDQDMNPEKISETIVGLANETEGFEQFSLEDFKRFKDRLIRTLAFEGTLGVASKALGVMLDHENVYCRARILTDIRPIFQYDLDEAPSASIIIHQLKIRYHQGKELKEFFVALDDRDIKSLKELLERAERKAHTLEGVLEHSGMKSLPVS